MLGNSLASYLTIAFTIDKRIQYNITYIDVVIITPFKQTRVTSLHFYFRENFSWCVIGWKCILQVLIPLDIHRKSCLASVKTEGVVGRRFKKAYSSFSKFNDMMYTIIFFLSRQCGCLDRRCWAWLLEHTKCKYL